MLVRLSPLNKLMVPALKEMLEFLAMITNGTNDALMIGEANGLAMASKAQKLHRINNHFSQL